MGDTEVTSQSPGDDEQQPSAPEASQEPDPQEEPEAPDPAKPKPAGPDGIYHG
jgi:hypothetical protein